MIYKSHKTIRWTWKWCQQHVYHCAASSLPLTTAHKHLEQLLGSWERNVVPFWFETWIYSELRVLLLFGLEDFDLCDHRTSSHFSSGCFKLALVMLLEHVCSSTHNRALTCVCVRHSELSLQTEISGSVPEPIQWFPWQNQVWLWRSAAWELKITASHYWFLALSPAHRDSSRFLESVGDIMLC